MLNPTDFIDEQPSAGDETPSDWIMRKAQETSGLWLDQNDTQRTQSMLAAIIAWVERDWMSRNPPKS